MNSGKFITFSRENAEIIRDYVPRLIKQYEELWDMSQSLLAAVEQWKAQGEGGQLMVADTKDVAALMRNDPPPF